MLEIFIPQNITNYGSINHISTNFLNIIKNTFINIEIKAFNSTFFEGIKLETKEFNEELLILCNGEFGAFYFMDFDSLENHFFSLGTKIIGENEIISKINEIMLNISEVIGILNSDKLLTNSKKEEIKQKIDESFFALSGVVFLLYSLKKQTENNIDELHNFKGKIEYEGQAQLLSETSFTKLIELKAGIDKIEIKIELFIDTIKSLIK